MKNCRWCICQLTWAEDNLGQCAVWGDEKVGGGGSRSECWTGRWWTSQPRTLKGSIESISATLAWWMRAVWKNCNYIDSSGASVSLLLFMSLHNTPTAVHGFIPTNPFSSGHSSCIYFPLDIVTSLWQLDASRSPEQDFIHPCFCREWCGFTSGENMFYLVV